MTSYTQLAGQCNRANYVTAFMVVCGMARGSSSLSSPFIAIYSEESPRSRLQTNVNVSNTDQSELGEREAHPVRLIIKRLLIIILCR